MVESDLQVLFEQVVSRLSKRGRCLGGFRGLFLFCIAEIVAVFFRCEIIKIIVAKGSCVCFRDRQNQKFCERFV